MDQLAGKVALVTGASRGLGRAIAMRFASAGATVVAIDLRAEWAQATADAIIADGGAALGLGCDVSDLAAVTAAIAQATEAFGGIDILVNNAMWNRYEPIAQITTSTAERMIGAAC